MQQALAILCAQDARAFPGPLCGGETESTGRVSGHGHDAHAFSQVQGRTFEKPGSGSRTFRPWMGGKRQAGWPFSLVTFSLATQRESNSRAEGARKAFDLPAYPNAKVSEGIDLRNKMRSTARC